MNTKIVMISSAVVLGLAGIVMNFLPDWVLDQLDIKQSASLLFLIQILGALYLAFAMLNWMVKGSKIGGIYNRPVAVANFTHFLIAGLGLIRGIISNPDTALVFWIVAGLYLIFGSIFGILLFRHPG